MIIIIKIGGANGDEPSPGLIFIGTGGIHIAISQSGCTRFYRGKPVFPTDSVSFTSLYFVTRLSW